VAHAYESNMLVVNDRKNSLAEFEIIYTSKTLAFIVELGKHGSRLEMCGTKKSILYRDRDRDRDQKKNFTGTRTGTDKKLPGPRPGPGRTLESEAI